MGRRCGTSQPTPTPLTCKAVADYSWALVLREDLERSTCVVLEGLVFPYPHLKATPTSWLPAPQGDSYILGVTPGHGGCLKR